MGGRSAHLPLPRSGVPDLHVLNRFDDNTVALGPDHAERVTRFREELSHFKIDPRGYKLCLQMRNELDTGVKLPAACEHVVFSQCAKYKDWKETRVC